MRRLLLVAALLTFAGCKETPNQMAEGDAGSPGIDAASAIDAAPPTASIQFAEGREQLQNSQFVDEVFTSEVETIHVVIKIPASPGLTFARFDLVGADGTALRQTHFAFSTEADAPMKTQHPEFPFQVFVSKVEIDSDGFASMVQYIRLAGTNIPSYKISGLYTGRVLVGAGANPTAVVQGDLRLRNLGASQ